MNVWYLMAIIAGISGQSILKRSFSQKNAGSGIYTFTAISCLAALLYFVFTSRGLQWDVGVIPYAFFFAVSYGLAVIFEILALAWGPLSLTALVTSFSLMIPTFYGLLFLKEPIGKGLLPGLALLSASVVLINRKGKGTAVTAKWLVCVLIAFAGNGLCSVVQKMQQNAFCGSGKNEFMILSMGIVFVIMCAAAVIRERRTAVSHIRSGWHLALGCGVMNAVVNALVMILSGLMSVSLMFPLISVGGIVVSFAVSRWIYREKLTKAQYIGFFFGIAAVIFLNL